MALARGNRTAAAEGGSVAEVEAPDPEMYALVTLNGTRIRMAASRLGYAKQRYPAHPFTVRLVTLEERDRWLAPSVNPLGGRNSLHAWSRLRFMAPERLKKAKSRDDLGLDIGVDERGYDGPVDMDKFRKHFVKQSRHDWDPMWLPNGCATISLRQAEGWLQNFGVDLQLWIDSYVAVLTNATPDGEKAADRPNLGQPYMREADLEKLSVWVEKRKASLKKEQARGIGIKEQRAPYGPGSKALARQRA